MPKTNIKLDKSPEATTEGDTKECPECGATIPADAVTCPECSADVSEETSPKGEQPRPGGQEHHPKTNREPDPGRSAKAATLSPALARFAAGIKLPADPEQAPIPYQQGANIVPSSIKTFLSLSEAAASLEIDELGVRRLYALGLLPAIAMGRGALKIADKDLNRYVAKGLPKLRMPQHDGRWFNEPVAPADLFCAVERACEPQFFNDARVQRLFADAPRGTDEIQGLLAVSPAVAAALNTKCRSGRSFKNQLLVDRLRAATHRILRADAPGQNPLSALYASPSGFASFTRQALAEVKQGRLTYRRSAPKGPSTLSTAKTVYYLPYAAFKPIEGWDALVKWAF